MKKTVALLLAMCLLAAAIPLAAAFSDVPAGSWYAQAVNWAVARGITDGVGDDQFGPNLKVTRAQAVTMLWRIAGAPTTAGGTGFPDVAANKWYAQAVAWSKAHNIASGYADGSFGPSRPVTRQELATFLYRFACYRDPNLTVPEVDLSGYADAGRISSYALEAMRWAVGNHIISGTSATTLSPRGTATRAQLVQMLYSWLKTNWELPFIPN